MELIIYQMNPYIKESVYEKDKYSKNPRKKENGKILEFL